MAKKQYDIIIFGSGIVGFTLAACLDKFGYKIAIIDKEPEKKLDAREEQRAFAVSIGSKEFLEKNNLWQLYEQEDISEIKKIHVVDGLDSDYFEFDASDINKPLGLMLYAEVIRVRIAKFLRKNSKNCDFFYEFNSKSLDMSESEVKITSESDEITAKLLIAVDGRNSFIRNKLAIKNIDHDYGQTALVGTIKHKNNHNNIALERFLPAGPFAILPLNNKNHSSIVWTESTKNAKKFIELEKSELNQELALRSKNYMEDPEVIGNLQAFPLNLKYSKQNIFHRTILLGDTSHGIHPLAGQGFNLAIRDIEILSELIEGLKLQRDQDPGNSHLLKEFSDMRKYDVLSLVISTHGLNLLFSNNNFFLKKSRKIALKLANKISPLKQFMLKRAAGL